MPCYIFLNNALSVCTELNTHGLFCMCVCAVVALRQVQRQVEREKEQMKEGERERTEHTLKQITHLQKQLKDKDKDRNLLLVSHAHTLSSILSKGESVAVLAHLVPKAGFIIKLGTVHL